jgi:hypothetical protein
MGLKKVAAACIFTAVVAVVILLQPFLTFSQETGENQNQGINLNFSVHDVYLAAHTLRSSDNFPSDTFKDDITAFQKYMEELSKDYFDKLMAIDPSEINPTTMDSPKLKELRVFIIQATEAPGFAKILSQTYEYGKACRDQWQKNYPQTFEIMKEISGLPLNKSFTVYITHPGLDNKRVLENQNVILWGHDEKWDNYATVYLWYEVMSTYLPKDDVGRAVLELLCYNHLRVQLNGGNYPPLLDGNPDLKDIKEKALEDWKAYLNSGNKNILAFIAQLRQKVTTAIQ